MSTDYHCRACDALFMTKEGDPFLPGTLMRSSEITFADGTKPTPGVMKPTHCFDCQVQIRIGSEHLYPMLEMKKGKIYGFTIIEDDVQGHPV